MGNYTKLYIDRLYLSWKYYVPTFLTFLFSPEEFFMVPDDDAPDRPAEIGFNSKASLCLVALNRDGYSLDFFSDVYDFFKPGLSENVAESVKDAIAQKAPRGLSDAQVQRRFAAHMAKFPTLTSRQELDDFVTLLTVLLSSDFNTPPFGRPVRRKFGDGRVYSISAKEYLTAARSGDPEAIDFENLQMYVLDKGLAFPPWILNLCAVFDEGHMFDYPEIVSLMFVRLALEAAPPDAQVKLDLSEVLDVEGGLEEAKQAVRELHTDLAHSLVEKVRLYEKVFATLLGKEAHVRDQYIKAECRELLASCDTAMDRSAKGRVLERLIDVLFTSNGLLELVDKRVSTGDEEIDIVVKNGVDRPFWNALNSPLFFIECKNWSSPVGSKEMRDFEGKLRNHTALVKVGFFVGMAGFTKDAEVELKRAGRADQLVVLLQRSDLDEFVGSQVSFFPWLEKRMVRLH